MKREISQFVIERAAAGDESAFGEIYFLLRDSIYGFAFRMTGEKTSAEDITQEVFMFLIQNPEKFDISRGTLYSFLCGVARNKIFNHLKKKGLIYEDPAESEELENVANSFEKTPLQQLLDQEFSLQIEQCIARLSTLQREVLFLREIEECSYEEIARITATAVGVVKSRLFRARRQLAQEMEPYLKIKEEMYL